MDRNLVRISSKVSCRDRAALLRQQAATIWLTGLPGSGKSTIAIELERRLHTLGHACFVLDGDNIRHGLSRDLGFKPEQRTENIRRVAEVARLLNDAGVIAISAFISPYRSDRAMAREIIGASRFIESYVAADVEVCERRDPKGHYRMARSGRLPDFTGVSAPYEAPDDPAIVIESGRRSLDECIEATLAIVLPRLRHEEAQAHP